MPIKFRLHRNALRLKRMLYPVSFLFVTTACSTTTFKGGLKENSDAPPSYYTLFDLDALPDYTTARLNELINKYNASDLLFYFIKKNKLDMVKGLVDQFKVDVNQFNKAGLRPIDYAIKLLSVDIAEWLINQSTVDINQGCTKHPAPLFMLIDKQYWNEKLFISLLKRSDLDVDATFTFTNDSRPLSANAYMVAYCIRNSKAKKILKQDGRFDCKVKKRYKFLHHINRLFSCFA